MKLVETAKVWQIVIPLLISAALCVLFTKLLLPVLRARKAGQSIREEGPKAHQAKSGTPTMGGLAMIGAALIAALLCDRSADTIACICVMLAYAAIGFVDDFIKVEKKRNLGLTPKQKLLLQVVVAMVLAFYRFRTTSYVFIPFAKIYVDFGMWYILFVIFVVVAMTNAVNLTDGLDGLASSVTAAVALCFALIAVGAPAVFAACICGICLGFLVYNHHPAKIFMGDTGSLALGGGLAAVAILSDYELVLPVAGGIYVIEALSVIIQVFVFKTQHGRRFFRMAPLHHHFELGGWKETKVVWVFLLVSVILCTVSVIMV